MIAHPASSPPPPLRLFSPDELAASDTLSPRMRLSEFYFGYVRSTCLLLSGERNIYQYDETVGFWQMYTSYRPL